jgi:hypothetical protein
MRNGGQPRVVTWKEFDPLISRGITFYSFIRQLVHEHIRSYSPPKTIRSRLHEREPITDYTLYFDPSTGAFGWITGKSPPAEYGKAKTQT